jgi:hypothetical protein
MAASGKTLLTEVMDNATAKQWRQRWKVWRWCAGDGTWLKAQQRCGGNNGDGDGRHDRAMAVAAMVGTTIAMAANGKTTIN